MQIMQGDEPTDIVYTSEVQRHTQHPLWNPLPASLLESYGTASRFIFSLYFCRGGADNDSVKPDPTQDQLIFECIMQLGDVELVARNTTMLHELHQLPAHVATGSHPLVVLLRCVDGVFFPHLEGMSASEDTLPRQSPTIASARLLPKSVVVAPPEDWDLIDLESVRSMEQRSSQRAESLTVGDIKTFAIATKTLHTTREFLVHQRDQCREVIDQLVRQRREEAARAATQFVSASVKASSAAEKLAKQEEIRLLKEEIEAKTAAINARRQRIQEQREEADKLLNMGTSCTIREDRQSLVAVVTEKQTQLANKISTIYSISSTTNCIDGLRVPEDGNIETSDHALAVGHVCHVLVVFCNVHDFKLPHPIILAANKSRIGERHGAPPDRWFPLFAPQRNSDRPMLRKGMELLRSNIISAAFAIHRQNQAEGLPLVLSLEKLITNR